MPVISSIFVRRGPGGMRGGQASPKNEVSASLSKALGRSKMSLVASWAFVEAAIGMPGQNRRGRGREGVVRLRPLQPEASMRDQKEE